MLAPARDRDVGFDPKAARRRRLLRRPGTQWTSPVAGDRDPAHVDRGVPQQHQQRAAGRPPARSVSTITGHRVAATAGGGRGRRALARSEASARRSHDRAGDGDGRSHDDERQIAAIDAPASGSRHASQTRTHAPVRVAIGTAVEPDPLAQEEARDGIPRKEDQHLKSTGMADAGAPAHGPRFVPVKRAASNTPCGPMTMSLSAKRLSGNAPKRSV